ncbi:hypothetical protein DMB90_08650 [Raoultella planticola]|uniref:Uncharacterized protein n=1 Tax=Raoultella planticola TaxID=575 RepID=A0A5P6A9J8_RAOPL|nr:hypothetical protein DMB90_08650 [Raoultella planticola]
MKIPRKWAPTSPGKNQLYNRLKPLMGNKRVLAIRPAKTVVNNGVSVVEKGSQLVVELQDREVKMLKGLGGELANVLLFPAATSRRKSTIALPSLEAAWPVSDDVILIYLPFLQSSPQKLTSFEAKSPPDVRWLITPWTPDTGIF